MAKFSFNKQLNKFVFSELGRIVDSDTDFGALLTRNGVLVEDEPEPLIGSSMLSPGDDDLEDDLGDLFDLRDAIEDCGQPPEPTLPDLH